MTNLTKSMSVSEALSWKENLGKTANSLRVLIYEGYQGKAWEPLGFTNWTSCIKAIATEFGFTEKHIWNLHSANQIESNLLNNCSVENENLLNNCSVENENLLDNCQVKSTVGTIPESHLRPLATLPDTESQQKAYTKATEKAANLNKPMSGKIMQEAVIEVKAELMPKSPLWVDIRLDAEIKIGDEIIFIWFNGEFDIVQVERFIGNIGAWKGASYLDDVDFIYENQKILKISRNMNFNPEKPTRQPNWKEILERFKNPPKSTIKYEDLDLSNIKNFTDEEMKVYMDERDRLAELEDAEDNDSYDVKTYNDKFKFSDEVDNSIKFKVGDRVRSGNGSGIVTYSDELYYLVYWGETVQSLYDIEYAHRVLRSEDREATEIDVLVHSQFKIGDRVRVVQDSKIAIVDEVADGFITFKFDDLPDDEKPSRIYKVGDRVSWMEYVKSHPSEEATRRLEFGEVIRIDGINPRVHPDNPAVEDFYAPNGFLVGTEEEAIQIENLRLAQEHHAKFDQDEDEEEDELESFVNAEYIAEQEQPTDIEEIEAQTEWDLTSYIVIELDVAKALVKRAIDTRFMARDVGNAILLGIDGLEVAIAEAV